MEPYVNLAVTTVQFIWDQLVVQVTMRKNSIVLF